MGIFDKCLFRYRARLFIQKVNNIPIEEVILDISAERLLHGLSGVVV